MVALALALQSAKLFQKHVILTLSGAEVCTRIFPSKMKFNHSVPGSDGGRLWRLLCLLVHPKTQHLYFVFVREVLTLCGHSKSQKKSRGVTPVSWPNLPIGL